jgi:hypothetical protein
MMGSEKIYNEARDSLGKVQTFDVTSLEREAELGKALNFKDAVDPAKELVKLFNRLSLNALEDFPDQYLKQVTSQANNIRKIFDNIIQFNPEQSDPGNAKRSLVQQVRDSYQGVFEQLHPLISYSLHKSADFSRLDAEARATIKGIEDKSEDLAKRLEGYALDGAAVLAEIRKVAAEEGVTQQAIYFKQEYESHIKSAEDWRVKTIRIAWFLGIFAFLSIFLHKIPGLNPVTTYDTVQLAISKVLIFFVIAYVLFLSARNFMSHTHNAVVNRHRQNALMTHKALVEASQGTGVRDAVLLQAAACIFSPQTTGYVDSKSEGEGGSQKSVVEIMSKSAAASI